MFLRASSAAKMLDLPLSTFHQLVREGKLPPSVSKLGRTRLWSRDQLVAAVDPRGYKAAHEHQAATGGASSGQAVRPGAVRIPARTIHGFVGAKDKAAGRSPYAGILGGAGEGEGYPGFGNRPKSFRHG